MKLGKKGNEEGEMHQIKGKIKKAVCKALKNPDLKVEGKNEKIKGQMQIVFPVFFDTFITEAIESQLLYSRYMEERKNLNQEQVFTQTNTAVFYKHIHY